MDEDVERATHHLVHEAIGRIEAGDASGQSLPDAEVGRLPGHDIAEFHVLVRGGAHDALAGMRDRLLVDGGIPRELEADLGRRGDEGLDPNGRHDARASLR
jgi:hypothetical protein